MSKPTVVQAWSTQVTTELQTLRSLLDRAGYTLDELQPHTMGERFLMQNISITSGHKLILLGQDRNKVKVVIKVTSDPAGVAELEQERLCRTLLETITFSYQSFFTPAEIAYWTEEGYTISIQEWIEQSSSFLARPVEDQFTLALEAFKVQESARATTASHYDQITNTFGIRTSDDYLRQATTYIDTISALDISTSILATSRKALDQLTHGRQRIEQYCGFLTHTDFVPHNFRIKNDTMYLLDTASLEFGNKHESWARFLNFMTLYNRELESHLITYLEKNRSFEERESLQLMRLYRLIEIITYYATTLSSSEHKLLELNTTRIKFWHNVLQAELQNNRVNDSIVATYQTTRDQLRSQDELIRQKDLH